MTAQHRERFMSQASEPGTRSPRTTELYSGAVLMAAVPVILRTSDTGGFCPIYLESIHPAPLEVFTGELLFWAAILIPTLLSHLLLRAARHLTRTAISAMAAALALTLIAATALPGTDLCTRLALPVTLPWPQLLCYPAAALLLLLAAKSPHPRTTQSLTLWTITTLAATSTTFLLRFPTIIEQLEPRPPGLTVFYLSTGEPPLL